MYSAKKKTKKTGQNQFRVGEGEKVIKKIINFSKVFSEKVSPLPYYFQGHGGKKIGKNLQQNRENPTYVGVMIQNFAV